MLILLSRLLTSLPAGKLFLYTGGGAAAGGALALACLYITWVANGSHYAASATKARLAGCLACLLLLRWRNVLVQPPG